MLRLCRRSGAAGARSSSSRSSLVGSGGRSIGSHAPAAPRPRLLAAALQQHQQHQQQQRGLLTAAAASSTLRLQQRAQGEHGGWGGAAGGIKGRGDGPLACFSSSSSSDGSGDGEGGKKGPPPSVAAAAALATPLPKLRPLGLGGGGGAGGDAGTGGGGSRAPVNNASAILDEEQNRIVRAEQALLERLHAVLLAMDADQDDLDILKDAISQVEDLFMVCVVGEFNAGKSRFINALLGDRYVKEGVTPTTAKICFVKHSDRAAQPTKYADAQGRMIDEVEDRYLPVDLLTNLALVDTPGTNAVIRRHSQLTHRIVPRADVVIFLTSIVRPFSDSERTFLQEIAQWHKKVVLVLNQIDLRPTEAEVAEVTAYVKSNARAVLGVDLQVFPISAKLALEAKLAAKPHHPSVGPAAEQWKQSNFGPLQAYLDSILTDDEKVRSKLSNPLGVAERLTESATQTLERRKALLASDLATLRLVDDQMDAFMKDMRRDVERERLAIDKCLRDMVDRAEDFLADHATIFNAQELWDSKGFARRFQQQVVGNLATIVDEIVDDMSELVAQRARTQARAVLDFLGRRPGERHQQMVGSVTETRFEGIRLEVLSKLQVDVKDVMASYEKDKEFLKLSEEIKASVMQTAAVEAGAATVGALVAAHAVDVTGGLITASTLALLGLVVLPYRRSAQKADFRRRVQELRQQMDGALAVRLDRELTKVRDRIMDCIGPYSRFVQVEDEKIKAISGELAEVDRAVREVRRRLA